MRRFVLSIAVDLGEIGGMGDALWMRLRDVKWDDYAVSTGSAGKLLKVLQDLASRKTVRAMRATHDVWKLLCSGGLHSAAVVTVPFLVEITAISSDEVTMEIFDVLHDCAVKLPSVAEMPWAHDLREVLLDAAYDLQPIAKRARGDKAIALHRFLDAMEG